MARTTLNPDATLISSILAVGFISGLAFWILEAYVDTLFIGGTSFPTRLFPADSHELWMRGLICTLVVVFGIYTGYLRWRNRALQRLNSEVAWLLERAVSKSIRGQFQFCASCKKIRDEDGFWLPANRFIASRTDALISAGLCHDCRPHTQSGEPGGRGCEHQRDPER